MPSHGIGCSPFGELIEKVSDNESIRALDTAIDKNGICYFDTTPYYGNGCSEITAIPE